MRRLNQIGFVSVLVIVAGLTARADADDVVRRSGRIISIAENADTFVLAEVGPWRVSDDTTLVTEWTITLTPTTEFATATRADAAPSGFAGDFIEVPVGPGDVHLSDFVTVVYRPEGTRLVALKIVVTEIR